MAVVFFGVVVKCVSMSDIRARFLSHCFRQNSAEKCAIGNYAVKTTRLLGLLECS